MAGTAASPTAAALRVATCNVLYEAYYLRHCKVAPVPPATRLAMFRAWLAQELANYDVLALQEFPYDGDAAAMLAALDAASNGTSTGNTSATATKQQKARGGAGRGAGGKGVNASSATPSGANAEWRSIVAAVAGAARWRAVAFDTDRDGVLFLVDANRFDVVSSGVSHFPKETFSGPGAAAKQRGRVVVKCRATGVVFGIVNAHVPWARDAVQSYKNVSTVYNVVDEGVTSHWVVVGDFNVAPPKRDRYVFLTKCGFPGGWGEATAELHTTTCATDRGDAHLDYILHSPSLQCVSVAAVPGTPSGNVQHVRETGAEVVWFSDHSAVGATVEVIEG